MMMIAIIVFGVSKRNNMNPKKDENEQTESKKIMMITTINKMNPKR